MAGKHASVRDDIVDYLDVKQQLLLSYCMNVCFYLYMKVCLSLTSSVSDLCGRLKV